MNSLACQSLGRERYEVVVVDNGSEADSAERLRKLCDRYGFRWEVEAELGLSKARNRAIAISKGRYIFFIDDDAVASAHLLETILDCFDKSGCDVVGGPAHGLWAETPPRWLGPRYWRMLSLVSYGPAARALEYPDIPIGCNIAFKKSVFDEFGLFRSDLGRRGRSLIGHEERELLQRVMGSGRVVMYEPRAYVFHSVTKHRMKVAYLQERAVASAISSRRVRNEEVGRSSLLSLVGAFLFQQAITIYHALVFAVELYLFESRIQIAVSVARRREDDC